MQSPSSPVFCQGSGQGPGQWTKEHVDILKEWKAKCFVNLWLQDASAYHYASINNWLSYPIIVISTASSATLFATDNVIVKYAVGILSLMSGIFASITRQMKPGEMHQQHTLTMRRYDSLIRHIDTCLSLTMDMRPHPTVFIEKIGVEIDNLMEAQLNPPARVLKSFERVYGPLDRMLYGEDIVELMRRDMQTSKMFRRIQRNTALDSSVPTLTDGTPPEEEAPHHLVEIKNSP